VRSLRDRVEATYNLSFPIRWTEWVSGYVTQVTDKQSIRAFRADHTDWMSLGFVLQEKRSRLKPEVIGLSRRNLKKLQERGGDEAIRTFYEHPLIAYTGDAFRVDPRDFTKADVLIIDASFLEEKHRKIIHHFTTEEALVVARMAKVKSVVLTHISPRYSWQKTLSTVKRLAEKMGIMFPVFVIKTSQATKSARIENPDDQTVILPGQLYQVC